MPAFPSKHSFAIEDPISAALNTAAMHLPNVRDMFPWEAPFAKMHGRYLISSQVPAETQLMEAAALGRSRNL